MTKKTFIFPFQFDITNNMSLLRRLIFKSYFLIEVKARHCQKILFCNAIFLKIKNHDKMKIISLNGPY